MRLPILRKTLEHVPPHGYLTSVFAHDLPHACGPVDVIYLPPRSGKIPRSVIVFLPGNPGLIGYYPRFLQCLQSLIDPSHGIIGLSHLGHCPTLAHPIRPLSLSGQIDAKCEFVRVVEQELEQAHGEDSVRTGGDNVEDFDAPDGKDEIRISLMGHSVGAEMCVQVMRRLQDETTAFTTSTSPSIRISALLLLFPTLANIARTPNGRRLRPIFHFPLLQVLPILAYLLYPLISILKVFAPTHATAQQPHPRTTSIYAPNRTTLSFLASPRTISHVLHLARSEMDSILDPDEEFYSSPTVRDRTWAYFGYEDGWVGREADGLKSLLRFAPDGAGDHVEQDSAEVAGRDGDAADRKDWVNRFVDCADGVPHAFCLGDEHTKIVAEKVAMFVRHAL